MYDDTYPPNNQIVMAPIPSITDAGHLQNPERNPIQIIQAPMLKTLYARNLPFSSRCRTVTEIFDEPYLEDHGTQ